MKYYSEKLDKMFDDINTLNKAERDADKKAAAAKKKDDEAKALKRESAKKVEKAIEDAHEAYKKANELQTIADNELKEFCKKYGYYHTSVNSIDDLFFPFHSIEDTFKKLFY